MDDNNIQTDINELEQTLPKTLSKQLFQTMDSDNEMMPFESIGQMQYQEADAMTICPNCGATMSQGSDNCEACRHYVKYDTCSFCGAQLQGDEAYCPECGNPRGGVVCPRCNTMNDFAFCKQCGMPLTDEAKRLLHQVRPTPEYMEMQKIADKLCELDKAVPMTSEIEVMHEKANQALRDRVLKLLAEDRGETNPVIPEIKSKRITQEDYKENKKTLTDQLMEALDALKTQPMEKPVEARNYAMAMKPAGLRLAWKCNYKNAIHSSPCGCAKPHLGGKWIILGQNTKTTKD